MGYVMSSLGELERLSRSKSHLEIQDATGLGRDLGLLVPVSVKQWRTPYVQHRTFLFDIEVHSWERGDLHSQSSGVLIKEKTVQARRRSTVVELKGLDAAWDAQPRLVT